MVFSIPPLLIGLAPVILSLSFIGLILFTLYSRRGQVRRGVPDQVEIDGNDQSYRWECLKGRAGDPVRSTLSIEAPSGVEFVLMRECALSRFAKWLGFTTKFQTGNAAFDDKIFIESDDDTIHNRLRDRPELRKLILELFASGVRSVLLLQCRLTFDFYPAMSYLSEALMKQRVGNLVDIKNRLVPSSLEEPVSPSRRDGRKAWQYPGNYLLMTGFLVFITVVLAEPVIADKYRFSLLVARVSIFAMIAGLAMLHIKFRRSSLGYKAFANFLFPGCLPLIVIVWGMLYNINRMDGDEPQRVQQPVLSKYIREGKGCDYELRVDGHYATYMHFHRGCPSEMDAIGFDTHAGLLGIQWIDNIRVIYHDH